jgi:hypothetical protein
MKKYLICPGWITSINDGDRHFITADELIRLYGVDRAQCQIAKDGVKYPKEMIRLAPNMDGKYRTRK